MLWTTSQHDGEKWFEDCAVVLGEVHNENVYSANGLESRLCNVGFGVFTHNDVPAGDGGLSLGQAMIAAHRTQSHASLDMHVKD